MARHPTQSASEPPHDADGVIQEQTPPAPSDAASAFTSNVPVVSDATGAPEGFAIAKRVTYPVIPFDAGMTIICRFTTAIAKGKELTASTSGRPKMAPAQVAIVESTTGEQCTLICGNVLEKELLQAYPEHGYVNRWFRITKFPKRGDRNYYTYGIVELTPQASAAA